MPNLRSDLIHAFLFRRRNDILELLQFRRTEEPLRGSWQPIMGHLHAGETAVTAAAREVMEETGLDVHGPQCLGWYALESVHPFFLPNSDSIVLSPSFAVEVAPNFIPRLCEEHDDWRVIAEHEIDQCLMWPGQRSSAREIRSLVISGVIRSLSR